ncbi:MAG: NADH-quinone oxidoreductase subunit NuoB [Candidatus Odinarchaeota archaeon]|nr:NADH-quinone oxidoreductase subunit NuoB [Candidatus Odinarchaeota archaeon]
MKEKLKKKAYEVLKRSVYVLRVDTGSCNGCEIEIYNAFTPYFDIERFGVRLVYSPRLADVLLVTGPVTRQFVPILKAVYEAIPKPCIVVACGACACGGGIWYDSHSIMGGVDKLIPVDVYIPGCPPRPQSILYGMLVALDVLAQKIEREEAIANSSTYKPEFSNFEGIIDNWELYKALKFELHRYLGYRFGNRVLEDLLKLSKECSNIDEFIEKAEMKIQEKYNDPRVTEAVKFSCLKLKDVKEVIT